MTTTKKTRKPRAPKPNPHPLAGINPELDALAALTPWPVDSNDLTDAEVKLLAAAAAKVADFYAIARHDRAQGGDGFDTLSSGAKILRALENYTGYLGIY